MAIRRRFSFSGGRSGGAGASAIFNRGSLQSSLVRRRFSVRSIVRPGSGIMVGRRGRRGGFFGSVFKGIKKVVSTVAKVPVLSTLAKTALGALPIVGSVRTAVNEVKRLTASGVAPSNQLVNQDATPGPTPTAAAAMAGMKGMTPGTTRKRKKKAKKAKPRKKAKRKAKAKGSKKGTAKQRAARARFARAAKKGRIKKGQKL